MYTYSRVYTHALVDVKVMPQRARLEHGERVMDSEGRALQGVDLGLKQGYSLVICYIAIEKCHLYLIFMEFLQNIVILNSYVNLPEGNSF